MTKICTKCKAEKDFSLFFKNKDKKYGLASNCKECHEKATKLWRKKNPERYKSYCRGRVKTPERTLKSKLRSRKHRKEMSDAYIRDLITMKSSLNPEDIPDEMVEMHRLNLAIKRQLELTPKLKGEEDKP